MTKQPPPVRALPRYGTSLPSDATALKSFGHAMHSSALQAYADVKMLLRKVHARYPQLKEKACLEILKESILPHEDLTACHPRAARPVSRVKHHHSRQLIRDSRALIASAKALIEQSRQSSSQCYYKIVCAWCQQTIRFERSAVTVRGLISHSICFACFADVFQELDPANVLLPVPTQADTAPGAPYLRLVP